METKRLADELCLLAERLGLTVRREALDPDLDGPAGAAPSAGGLVRLRGRTMILVDPRRPAEEQAEVLAEALTALSRSGQVDLEGVFVLPELRDYLERFGTA